MKILYITTIGGTMSFFKSLISKLVLEGNTVDIATNESTSKIPDFYRELGCQIYHITTSRSPLSIGNIKAIRQIRRIAENYDVVHCHTPLAGMATRLACKRLRKRQNLKVIYTAHGFHFYKGAPKKNWMIYYPIEKMCSKWTDVLITINKEDYKFACKKMKAKRIEYVPGVGIDIKRFTSCCIDKDATRAELGIPKKAFLILSVGELNENKNHQIVIKAIGKSNDLNIHYMIAGVGNQEESLIKLAKDLNVNLHLLGYRKDVEKLYKCADLFVLPSFREGLNVSLMEAMASGCPVIASKIRGNTDMVPLENCFSPYKVDDILKLLHKNIQNSDFIEKVDIDIVNKEMLDIYYGKS